MIPIRRGNLKHLITIKTTTTVADGIGGFTETEVTFLVCRAAIWPVSAKEKIQSDQLEMQTTHRIRIDWQTGILPSMMIYFGTRKFEIVSIINADERSVVLDILAKEFGHTYFFYYKFNESGVSK